MAHTDPLAARVGVRRAAHRGVWTCGVGIQPICAGLFGAPAAFLTIVVVSLLTPPLDRATRALVDYLREPGDRA